MIRDKTAVLLGAVIADGCITAYASEGDLKQLYLAGLNAGISWLMDDYLKCFLVWLLAK